MQVNEALVLTKLAAKTEEMPHSASSGRMELLMGLADPVPGRSPHEMEASPRGSGPEASSEGIRKKESKSLHPDGVPTLDSHGQNGHRLARNLFGFTTKLRFFTPALLDY